MATVARRSRGAAGARDVHTHLAPAKTEGSGLGQRMPRWTKADRTTLAADDP
jgi:hypothetical protein